MMVPDVGGLLALHLALAFAWRLANDVEAARDDVWKRVAYATRYGKGCSLGEALGLPQEALTSFLRALGQLVEEENRANQPKK